MPPKKRSAGKSRATRPTRAKRPRPSDLQEIAPAEIETSHPTRAEPAPPQGLVSIDVSAISTTISAVVSQALQSALSSDNVAAILKPSSVGTDSHSLVEEAVLHETRVITENRGSSAGTGGETAQIGCESQGNLTGGIPISHSSTREPNAEELVSNYGFC